MGTISRITPAERVDVHVTPGIVREQAGETDGMWSGFVRTEPGMVSGWHHHGDYDTTIFVLDGSLRMEFGSGGEESFEAGPGDFVFVGKQVVHRESDPSTEGARLVVVRAGQGEPVISTEGPG